MAAELLGISFGDSSGINWNESDRTKLFTFTDVYTVSAASAGEAQQFGSLPKLGSTHSFHPLARCVSRSPRFKGIDGRTSGYSIYDVDVSYSTNASVEEDEEENDVQPWDLEPEWWWDTDTIDVLVTEDAVTGQPIDNSADDRIYFTWPMPIPVLHIERYQLVFSPNTILNYVARTNSATFWGAPAAAAMMHAIRPRRESVNGLKLWRVHYEIRFRIDGQYGWLIRVLDEGYNYIDAGVRKRAIDALGNPIKVNLNGSGGIVAAGGTKTFLTFDGTPRVDFNTLQLGPWM